MGFQIFVNDIERCIETTSFKYKKDGTSRQSLNLQLGGYTEQTLLGYTAAPQQFDKVDITINGGTKLTNKLGITGNFNQDRDDNGIADGWSTSSALSAYSWSNQVQSFTPSIQWGGVITDDSYELIAGHIYYFYGSMTTTDDNGRLYIMKTGSNISADIHSGSGEKEFLSGRFTSDVSDNSAQMKPQTARTSGFVNIDIEGCGFIDLTQAYGAGNEPSKATMDYEIQRLGGHFNNTSYTGLFFNGFIDDVVSIDFNTGYEKLLFNVIVLPYENRLGYLYCNKTYNAPNQVLSDIVNSLYTDFMVDEDITIGAINILDDITIEYQEFNQETTVIQALDELAALGNYVWYIDKDKGFYFFKPGEYDNTVFAVDETTCLRKIKNSNNIGKYRNRQIMYGGNARNNVAQIERVSGDDIARQWEMTYKISEINYIRIIDENNPDPQPGDANYFDSSFIGIFGLDDEDDNKVWLYNTHSNLVKLKDQLSDGTPLRIIRSDELLEMEYLGFIPSTVQIDSASQINEVKNKIGGTGVVEFVDKDETLNDYNAVANTAESWLSREARFKTYTDFTLHSSDYPDVFDWEPGDLINVSGNPVIHDGIYTINELDFALFKNIGDSLDFEVQIKTTDTSAADFDSWVDFWKQKAKDKRGANKTDESIFKYILDSETIGVNEEYSLVPDIEAQESIQIQELLELNDKEEFNEEIQVSELLELNDKNEYSEQIEVSETVSFAANEYSETVEIQEVLDLTASEYSETIQVGEEAQLIMIFQVYPSLTTGTLGGVEGSIIYDNYSTNPDLYIYE